MGVMLQTFFWDCPRVEDKEFQWWNSIREHTPSQVSSVVRRTTSQQKGQTLVL